MLTGTIVGIETGHRWNIQNYFIEPQVQLTYSYLRPENYNTNLREVKFDDMKSLIARVWHYGRHEVCRRSWFRLREGFL